MNDNVLYGSFVLASFPGPRPASCRFQYSKALYCTESDRELGKGLGARLLLRCYVHSFIDEIQRDNR